MTAQRPMQVRASRQVWVGGGSVVLVLGSPVVSGAVVDVEVDVEVDVDVEVEVEVEVALSSSSSRSELQAPNKRVEALRSARSAGVSDRIGASITGSTCARGRGRIARS